MLPVLEHGRNTSRFVTTCRMTPACQSHSHCDQMSTEVRAAVFANMTSKVSGWHQQREVCKLPCVCTKFRDVINQYANFTTRVRLPYALDIQHVPGLMQFIWKQSGKVADLKMYSENIWLEALLGAMLLQQVPLNSVSCRTPEKALHLLAAFKTITKCSIQDQPAGLSLQPMQALPNLADLTLWSGDFTAFEAAGQHLTCLKVRDCKVAAFRDCECVSSLLHLQLESSHISFHMLGLSACSHLISLTAFRSSVYTMDAVENFSFADEDHYVPESLTNLTALSSLSFACCVKDKSVRLVG